MEETRFYRCNICGNVIIKVTDSGVLVECCSEKMEELHPQFVEKGSEKHVPVCTWEDDCTMSVKVGDILHPMSSEHHIEWIYLETSTGGQFVYLPKDGDPCAQFQCKGASPISVYAYCNIHGLWKLDLEIPQACLQKYHQFNLSFFM